MREYSSGSVRSRGAGFTLVEVIVALVVVALLAGVVMTQVVGRLTGGETAALSQDLRGLSDAIVSFRGDVRRFPSQLGHLVSTPASGATDTCGRLIPDDFLEEWRGPYLDRGIPSTGLVSGTSVIRNDLRRDPSTYSSFGILYLDVEGVDQEVAERIEAAFDGNADFGGGSVRWTDSGGGRGTLSYGIPIRGC
jgi:prepilin-type N-terminal cleavage/methylation domain-containing protein